jgi:predicted membrane protein
MDTQDPNTNFRPTSRNSRVLAGLFLVLVGAAFLLREMAFPFFPDWLFTWPMILIAIGIYIGLKHDFRGPAWLILLIIGTIFLADQAGIGVDMHRFLVPAIIIAVGLIMIMRPRYDGSQNWHKWRGRYWDPSDNVSQNTGEPRDHEHFAPGPATPQEGQPGNTGRQPTYSGDDYIDSTSVFGGVKKVIVSKNFRGGEITCFMGGADIDLTQSDINGTIVLDVTCMLGGAKLTVPSNWTIKSEMSAIFGGIEDKRKMTANPDPGKVLLIKGTCFMGGFEFRSY